LMSWRESCFVLFELLLFVIPAGCCWGWSIIGVAVIGIPPLKEFIGCREAATEEEDVGLNKLSNADKSGLVAACEGKEELLNPGADAKFPNVCWLLKLAPKPVLVLFTLLLQEVSELRGLVQDIFNVSGKFVRFGFGLCVGF